MVMGVYRIRCRVSGLSYVGGTKDVTRNWSQCCYRLRRGLFNSKQMQSDYNVYGLEAFELCILEEVYDPCFLKERCYHWIKVLEGEGEPLYNKPRGSSNKYTPQW